MAEGAKNKRHNIQLDNVNILSKEAQFERICKEAIEIEKMSRQFQPRR